MLVDPITVSTALASPIVGFDCAVFAAGYFAYTLAPTRPPDCLNWTRIRVGCWGSLGGRSSYPSAQARALLDTLHEARRNQMEVIYAANRPHTEAFLWRLIKSALEGEQYHRSLQKHFCGGVDEIAAAFAAAPSLSDPEKLIIFLSSAASFGFTWVITGICLSLLCHPPRLPCPLEFSLEEARKYRLIPWQEMPRVLPVNGLAAFLPSAEAAAEVVDTTSDFDSALAPATAPPR